MSADAAPHWGFVTGLAAEAKIVRRFGCPVEIGGGTPEGALGAAERLAKQGVNALVSFGFAGGLDPGLPAGALIVPATVLSGGKVYRTDPALAVRFGGSTGHCLIAGPEVVATVRDKRALHEATGAHAIDLESGSVAQVAELLGLRFIAVRAISDTADRDLPPAALLALDRGGRIGVVRVLASVLRNPAQVPGLLRLASDAANARRALVGAWRADHAALRLPSVRQGL